MEGIISLKKCLETMYEGGMFSFRVVTYDKKKRNRSGRIIEFTEAQLLWVKGDKKIETISQLLQKSESVENAIERDPAHRENQTLNVRICVAGRPTPKIVKIHPILLLMFNKQKVVL